MLTHEENPIVLPGQISLTTMAGCIDIFDNIFSEQVSDNIIKSIEDANSSTQCPINYQFAEVGQGDRGGDFRSNLVMPISPHQSISGNSCSCKISDIEIYIRSILTPCVNYYTNKYEMDIAFDEGLQLLKYNPGKEYKAHTDYGPGHDHRVLSALIYLNPSGYEGGGTFFENFEINLKVSTPSIVLFPSNYAYHHRAKPVLDGIKYAMVTWLGPPWSNYGRG